MSKKPRRTVYVSSPHPRDVDGFDEASARGWLPVVPVDPPALLPGPTSNRALGEVVAAGLGGTLLIVLVAEHTDSAAVLGVLSTALLVGVGWMFNRHEVRLFQEFAAGYHIRVPILGASVWDRDGRWRGENDGARWDARGLWKLKPSGEVVWAPSRTTLPPGWYPSPNRPGQFEFWTGAQWAYRYLPRPDARTEQTRPFGTFWTNSD